MSYTFSFSKEILSLSHPFVIFISFLARISCMPTYAAAFILSVEMLPAECEPGRFTC